MAVAKPTGGKIVTPTFLLLAVLSAIGLYYMAQRFIFGIGAVSNLTDVYPWGIWITVDVAIGTALACGGYGVAILVYILNRGQYHHFIRPAMTASLIGYSFAGLAVTIDVGRYHNLINFLKPQYWQPNSVLFEVGLCVMSYTLVLGIECMPFILERFVPGDNSTNLASTLRGLLNKVLIVFICLGILLPTMHQSALGGLMLLVGNKLSPLWQTPMISLQFLISCIAMGFAMLVIESMITHDMRKSKKTVQLLSGVANVIKNLFIFYFILRVIGIVAEGGLAEAFAPKGATLSFWLEIGTLIAGIALIRNESGRKSPKTLFISAMLLAFSASWYRVNAFIIGFSPAPGATYFPSAPEMMITIGMVSLEILIFGLLIKTFPILVKE